MTLGINGKLDEEEKSLQNERLDALEQFESLLEPIVTILGFVWLALLVVELAWGVNPLIQALIWLIWGIFLVDFAIRFILAPQKSLYLRKNWLTAVSLLIPALRFLRVVRVARLLLLTRAARGAQLIRVVSSVNRGIRSLRKHIERRGAGYVALLSVIIAFVGAAAIYSFEAPASGGAISNFWDALYWTAMMLATIGSDYWPVTAEGRVIAFLLALYAFAMFGYITATLATFFIGRDAQSQQENLPAAQSIQELHDEIQKLNDRIDRLFRQEE